MSPFTWKIFIALPSAYLSNCNHWVSYLFSQNLFGLEWIHSKWIHVYVWLSLGFPSGPMIKNPPAMQEPQEMRVRSPSWEKSLEEGLAIHFSILAGRIPWTEEPGGLQSMGLQSQARLKWLSTHMAEFLCCSPKTIIVLLIGFTPI